MAFALTSPVTGATQTGLSSPTYTLTADSAATQNIKRWIVSQLGGTQTGVTVHTASQQFSVEVEKPISIKQLGFPGSNGQVSNVPNNRYMVRVRKSLIPAANQLPRQGGFNAELIIPAGAETYDQANVRAMLSLGIGSLVQQSAGLGDTVVSGTL